MGIFSSFKNVAEKSTAAVLVQNHLEEVARDGLFDKDPARFANKLVQITWDSRPDAFSGKMGRRPHKATLAAASLATGIKVLPKADLDRNGVILAMGRYLSNFARAFDGQSFGGIDEAILNDAEAIYLAESAELAGEA